MEKIRLRTPHESLALIPHLVGFRPQNSIVIMALKCGFDRASGPIIRIEIDEEIPDALIDVALDFIESFEVFDLAIAWYGSNLADMIANQEAVAILDTAGLAAQRYLDAHTCELDEGFVTVSLTDYTHWAGCMDVRDAAAIPFDDLVSEGLVRPFDELNESPAVTELVFHGSAPLADEPEHPDLRVPFDEREEAVIAARDERARTSQRRKCGNVWQQTLERVRQGLPCHEAAPSAETIGLLNAGLDSIVHRDRVILAAVNSTVTDILKVRKHQISRLLGEARPATSTYLSAITELVEYIARYSDDDDPAAFAVAAYLRWWADDSEGALVNALVASESDPSYSLADLVRHALFVGLPPPFADPQWARSA